MKINTPRSGAGTVNALAARQPHTRSPQEANKPGISEQDPIKKAIAPELATIQEAETLGKNLAGRLNLNQSGALDAVGQLDEQRIESLLADKD